MTVDKKIKDLQKRFEAVKKWQSRLDKLSSRKTNPMNESEFCRKYGFDRHRFNRNKKSTDSGVSFPTEKTFDLVEKAFKKERV